MPRKQVFPPPIKRCKSTNWARVWWQGKWHPLGPWGSTRVQQEYARFLARISSEQSSSTDPAPAPSDRPSTKGAAALTIADLTALWLATEAPRLSERGGERPHYERAIRVLNRVHGNLPVNEFRRRHLRDVQQAMATGSWLTQEERDTRGTRYPDNWCSRVVNRMVIRLRTIMRWAEGEEYAPPGSWAHLLTLEGLAENDPTVRHTDGRAPAEWQDVKAVCRLVPPVVRALVLAGWWSGCRPSELREMRVSDVDTSGPDPDIWVYTPRQHKTDYLGHAKVIVFGPRAQAAIRPWLEEARQRGGTEAFVFAPRARWRQASKGRRRNWTPRVDFTRCYSDNTLAQCVRRAAERAGVQWTPYELRHAAKDRIARKEGSHAARVVLGHRHLSTTDGYGESVDVQHAKEIQRRHG